MGHTTLVLLRPILSRSGSSQPSVHSLWLSRKVITGVLTNWPQSKRALIRSVLMDGIYRAGVIHLFIEVWRWSGKEYKFSKLCSWQSSAVALSLFLFYAAFSLHGLRLTTIKLRSRSVSSPNYPVFPIKRTQEWGCYELILGLLRSQKRSLKNKPPPAVKKTQPKIHLGKPFWVHLPRLEYVFGGIRSRDQNKGYS